MPKRHYYETEEVITRKKKGWIEVDTDYTQVYNCFQHISKDIKSIVTMKLLFWLLVNKANKQNGFTSDDITFKQFNVYLGSNPITKRTFTNCIKELVDVKAINKVSKGFYYFTPYVFWQDKLPARMDFIEAESKDSKSYNPKVIELPTE